jgi:serine protein kinase
VLLAAASQAGTSCVTVPKVFEEIRQYLTDTANHRWMSLEPDSTFHLLDGDKTSISHAAWGRWLDLSDWEVREALGLVDEARYMDLFRRYVTHVSHALKGERLFDEHTGELTEPDDRFMSELERTMVPEIDSKEKRRKHRADILSRIGAWALSHPNEDPAYDEIFPDYFSLLREDYYKQQKETVRKSIQKMLSMLAEDGEKLTDEPALTKTEERQTRHALEVMLGEHDGDARRERHTRETLKETLVHLVKARY